MLSYGPSHMAEQKQDDQLEPTYTYLPTPLLRQDMTRGQFFKWSLTGLNSEFSFF